MKALLELSTNEKRFIEVPEHLPRLISGWSSSIGIRGGKDSLIFAMYRSTVGGQPIYEQVSPEKFLPPKEVA